MSLAQGFIRHLLHAGGHEGTNQSSDDDSGEHHADRSPPGGDPITQNPASQKDSGKAAAHEDFTVGEVNETQNSVDQGVAHGDHRVDGTVLKADREVRPKSCVNLIETAEPEVLKPHGGASSPYVTKRH